MSGGRGGGRRRCRAGVTLVELVVAITIVLLMTLAVTSAFVAGLDVERLQTRRQSRQVQIAALERQITLLLEGAKMSDSSTDQTTYFQSDTSGTGGGDSDLGSDRVTFTTVAPGIPLAAQTSADDFETQMQTRGPVGGVAEVSLSTTAESDPGDGRTGLFLRVQRPSDGDATQGGVESVLSPLVEEMGFQFWDGVEWVSSWDTQSTDSRRLPSAVQVSYTLKDDPQKTVYRFIVPIPTSDVTPQNPVTTAGGAS